MIAEIIVGALVIASIVQTAFWGKKIYKDSRNK